MMNPWFQVYRPTPKPRLRLFCIPYAGAGASAYRSFAREAPPQVEVVAVQLPGHESRIGEPLIDDIQEIGEKLHQHARAWLAHPYCIFGHSMGALVALEWARRVVRDRLELPNCVIVSARPAPHLPLRLGPFHQLHDRDFLAILQSRYDAVPDLIAETPELLRMFLPMLRNDFRAVERYTCQQIERLPIPLAAIGGTRDDIAEAWELEQWRVHTSRQFYSRCFVGSHLFLHEHRKAIMELALELVKLGVSQGTARVSGNTDDVLADTASMRSVERVEIAQTLKG